MIGERIKQARKASGLSLRALADKAGVSAMAISKYENEQATPSSTILLALAKALNVRVEYFFRQVEVNLEDVEYRHHYSLGDKDKIRILAEVREQVERWMEFEAIVPATWAMGFKVPKGLPAKINSYDEIENFAVAVRKAWKIGLNPILDLIDTLESRGIKVFTTKIDAGEKFDGLAAQANGSPVIVVSEGWPGDRQRFTLAHELGHLVLKGRLKKSLDEEKACHRFAGAFLVPADKVIEVLGNRRTWLEPQELSLLKAEFGLSMGGWTYRAFYLGILPQSRMSEIWNYFRQRGWDKKEPDPQYPKEETRVFKQLVYRALAEDLIGESKAAELLGITLMDLRSYRKMESPKDVVNQ